MRIPNHPDLKKLHVAVVDDHEPFRVGTCRLLERRGFASSGFGSVAEFIGSGEVTRIDCLILDVGMPEIDGFALFDCLRETNYQFPIIFCSGQDRNEKMEQALSRDGVSFLQKPVQADTLAEAVRTACATASSKPPRS